MKTNPQLLTNWDPSNLHSKKWTKPIARNVKGMHTFILFLGLPVPERPWPQRHCLCLTKGLSAAQVSDLIWDPRVWGTFRKHCRKSKKLRKICISFLFSILFQKFFLETRSSISACQIQLFSSVLSWPLHRFCCQGPGLMGSVRGTSAWCGDTHTD